MKLLLLLILPAILFYGCTNNNKNLKNNANELAYETADVNSGALSVATDLKGEIKKQELSVQIKLSNTESKDLEIQEIAVSTTEGSHSLPSTIFAPFLLKQGNDTTLILKFNPFNNYKLYQVTGMHGGFKPAYNITISYKITGSDSTSTLSLKSTADESQYAEYLRKHVKPVTGYSFNSGNGFTEKQVKYLKTLKQLPQPPFLFLSGQEIAVSGLNFRFKNYYQQDTLHAELSIVNHSNFPVKIIPDAFDITTADKLSQEGVKTVRVEKVSGTQQNLSMIEKGDRAVIHFKKFMKINSPGKETLQLHLNKVFMVKDDKVLFNEDIELLPESF
jgi:hypothetical protein